MITRTAIGFLAIFILHGCGKSDVERCVDAQVESFKECKRKNEDWCKNDTEASSRADASLVCLKMSGQSK
jgi:hypothetical protein